MSESVLITASQIAQIIEAAGDNGIKEGDLLRLIKWAELVTIEWNLLQAVYNGDVRLKWNKAAKEPEFWRIK